uniref:Small integral membrane protein n=1 Tax=Candidatus Kentrum sp. SD TaxID=2126332 RepID=A0A450YSB9_9GAMM|nr:MAG: hypothetical protein BECKSD772F_GA0070984_105715 [Candidatus Kentron sp. SD]VFK44415.1 MAG: hypothetical protein BECKSD772E_GA0070983_103725 [Candidatus Kentron sp. SD]
MNLIRQNKENYGEPFQEHLFEQYKLYVEMADRVSARRMLANSFFVGVHTALIIAFAILLKQGIIEFTPLGFAPFIAVFLLCFVWWRIVRSYRQLNSGKYKVVLALEQMLPVAPYDEEWGALGSGEDPKKYSPLTHVEQWVPACFGLLYILLAGTLYYKG